MSDPYAIGAFAFIFALGITIGAEWQHYHAQQRDVERARSAVSARCDDALREERRQQFADAAEAEAIDAVRRRISQRRSGHTWD